MNLGDIGASFIGGNGVMHLGGIIVSFIGGKGVMHLGGIGASCIGGNDGSHLVGLIFTSDLLCAELDGSYTSEKAPDDVDGVDEYDSGK